MSKFGKYELPSSYPPDIEETVGRLSLLFGQVDRLLIEYFSSCCGANQEGLIGHVRSRKFTFGTWINFLNKTSEHEKFHSCVDVCVNKQELIEYMEKLKFIRDRIHHDSLLRNEDGDYVWISNGNRPHKYLERELQQSLKHLKEFRDDLSRWINTESHCSPAPVVITGYCTAVSSPTALLIIGNDKFNG